MPQQSPLQFKTGDLLKEDAEALVNTVNCVGVMGRGVALQFKRAFPANFKAYQAACRKDEVRLGRMFVFETGHLTNPRYIINFPTKQHWRGRSRLSDIEAGLQSLVTEVTSRGIVSLALPPLGSGLGGLDWAVVRAKVQVALETLDGVRVTVFEPQASGDSQPLPVGAKPRMTPGRAALVGLIKAYLVGHLDPLVTLLELHKLVYFMQEAGEPLRLDFAKGTYGPYANNLRHVMQSMEGHYTSGYFGADTPTAEIAVLPGAEEEAEAILASSRTTGKRFARVVALVKGFETPHGLELLATVHWVARRETAVNLEEVVRRVYEWGPRKARFTPGQIQLAYETLAEKEWVQPFPIAFAG